MARILIVDDEEGIQLTFREFLREEGHEVILAASAEEGRVLLHTTPPDILITDIILPQSSGLELLRYTRTLLPDVQMIVITGGPSVETAVQAVRCGALDYLGKPVTRHVLLKSVKEACAVKEGIDRRHDFLARMRKEQAELKRVRRGYDTLIENVSDGVVLVSEAGVVLYGNQTAASFVGLTPATMEGKHVSEFLPPREAALHMDMLRTAIESNRPALHEFPMPYGGTTFLHRIFVQPLTDPERGEALVIFIEANVHLERETARRLRESEARYRELVERVGEGVLTIDDDAHIRFLNPAAAAILGGPTDSLLGAKFAHFLNPTDYAALFPKPPLEAPDAPIRGEAGILTLDGATRYGLFTVTARADETGARDGSFIVVRDITAMREAQVALKESESFWRRTLDASGDGICIIRQYEFVYVNTRLAAWLAVGPEEAVGRSFLDFVHPDDRETAATTHRDHIEHNRDIFYLLNLRLMSARGDVRHVKIDATLLEYGDDRLQLVIAHDTKTDA